MSHRDNNLADSEHVVTFISCFDLPAGKLSRKILDPVDQIIFSTGCRDMTDFFSKTSKGTSSKSSSSGVHVLPTTRPDQERTLVSSLLASDNIDKVSSIPVYYCYYTVNYSFIKNSLTQYFLVLIMTSIGSVVMLYSTTLLQSSQYPTAQLVISPTLF